MDPVSSLVVAGQPAPLNDILAKAFTCIDGANLRQHDGVESQRAHACLVINLVNLILSCRARLSFSTNGSVMLLIVTGNCDITACPNTSAVIAVPIRNIKNVAINSIIHFVLPVMQT
ncbi:hypothetical protein ACLB1E_20860 [Escherichia coli]